ncbi:hypothetical protein C451_04561 [Halococcus thailandensis JCM 13552]|uniref:Uncharacterized protein n=1 Tax=Halococcus thailandensis JCM 13552 TaxID=1227457 RepID=M0NDF3_9EURY|nr:hypothetical protein C451_04561 [Halococcus thailandensis JCM 13552]
MTCNFTSSLLTMSIHVILQDVTDGAIEQSLAISDSLLSDDGHVRVVFHSQYGFGFNRLQVNLIDKWL